MRWIIAPVFAVFAALPGQAEVSEGPAARLVEAHRLAALGERLRDPVLVFAAARLMQGLALVETRVQPAKGGPADYPDSADRPAQGSADPTSGAAARVPDPSKMAPLPGQLNQALLFQSARQMAPEGSPLREAIALAAAEVSPAPAALQVAAQDQNGAQDYALTLPGGDPVQIGLLRLEGSLSFTLTDPEGKVLCQDASTSAASLCTVTLPETQILTLSTQGKARWLLATP